MDEGRKETKTNRKKLQQWIIRIQTGELREVRKVKQTNDVY